MSDLLSRIGRANLERLASVAGGTRLFIPKHYGKPPNGGRDGSARLVALVGPDLAVLLVFHYGDSRIYVPTLRPAKPVDRRKFNRLAGRKSNREIARNLGCSVRTVEKLQAKAQAARSAKPRA